MCIVVLGMYNVGQLMKNVPFQHFFLNWSIKVLRFQIPGECMHQKENYFLLLNMNDFKVYFLSGKFSQRQAKVEVLKIQNPDFSHWD